MIRYKLNEHNIFGYAPCVAERTATLDFPDDTPVDEQYVLIGKAHAECVESLRREAQNRLSKASDDVSFYSITDANGIRDPAYVERPFSEPMVCGGTGNHDGQPIADCDECNPSNYE